MKLADLLISSAGCTVFGSADKDVEDLIYHSDKADSVSYTHLDVYKRQPVSIRRENTEEHFLI